MKFTTLCAGLAWILASALPAQASPITYSFTGVVDSDDAGRGWQSFKGSFTFDSNAGDGIADPSTAAYAHTGAPWGMSVSFDGASAVNLFSVFNLLVSNNLGGSDALGALAQDDGSGQSLSLTLFDFSQTVFASDALPLPGGGLNWASFGWSSFSYEVRDESFLQGHLTGLSCTSGCASTEPPVDLDPPPHRLPEPSSLTLLALGLASLRARRARPQA